MLHEVDEARPTTDEEAPRPPATIVSTPSSTGSNNKILPEPPGTPPRAPSETGTAGGANEAEGGLRRRHHALEVDEVEPVKPLYVDVTYWDIAREFSLLGYIGFGGPAAHIGLFQKVHARMHAWRMHCLCAGRSHVACAMYGAC